MVNGRLILVWRVLVIILYIIWMKLVSFFAHSFSTFWGNTLSQGTEECQHAYKSFDQLEKVGVNMVVVPPLIWPTADRSCTTALCNCGSVPCPSCI